MRSFDPKKHGEQAVAFQGLRFAQRTEGLTLDAVLTVPTVVDCGDVKSDENGDDLL
jgi:hypothetical protein